MTKEQLKEAQKLLDIVWSCKNNLERIQRQITNGNIGYLEVYASNSPNRIEDKIILTRAELSSILQDRKIKAQKALFKAEKEFKEF